MSDQPNLPKVALLERTRTQPKRCAACGGRGWRLDLDERCEQCNPCCEEHFPSEAMTPEEQAEHICPVCSWMANPDYLDWLAEQSVTAPPRVPEALSDEDGEKVSELGRVCEHRTLYKGRGPNGWNLRLTCVDCGERAILDMGEQQTAGLFMPPSSDEPDRSVDVAKQLAAALTNAVAYLPAGRTWDQAMAALTTYDGIPRPEPSDG